MVRDYYQNLKQKTGYPWYPYYIFNPRIQKLLRLIDMIYQKSEVQSRYALWIR